MDQLDLFDKYDAMEYAVSLTTYELRRLEEQDYILYCKVKELRREAANKRFNRESAMRGLYRRADLQSLRAMFVAKIDDAEYSHYPRR